MYAVAMRGIVLALCCCGLAQVGPGSDDLSKEERDAEIEKRIMRDPRVYVNWSLRLESVRMDSDTITEIHATLKNLSYCPVTIDRNFEARQLPGQVRIWGPEKEGSYRLTRLRSREEPGSLSSRPPAADRVELKPGESVRLDWKLRAGDSDEDGGRYRFVYDTRYCGSPGQREAVSLPAGTYAVDMMIDAGLHGLPEDFGKASHAIVYIPTDNKQWVTIKE